METMTPTRMTWFSETWKAYPQEMIGFLQNRLAIDNIIALVSLLEEWLSSGGAPTTMFLDIKTAFDLAVRTAIFAALEYYGFGGK